jgi:hypothetical protein
LVGGSVRSLVTTASSRAIPRRRSGLRPRIAAAEDPVYLLAGDDASASITVIGPGRPMGVGPIMAIMIRLYILQ